MISRKQTEDSIVKLGMLKYFPARADVTAEVGRLLNEICADDHEAKCLTSAMLSQFDEWPGPSSLQGIQKELVRTRQAARQLERQRAIERANRDTHEAECKGHTVTLHEEDKYVSVNFCRQQFGYYPELLCRKGGELESIDPTFCGRTLEQELAMRPGWISSEEHWKQVLAKHSKPVGAVMARSPALVGSTIRR